MIGAKEKGGLKGKSSMGVNLTEEIIITPLQVLKFLCASIFGLSTISLIISFIKFVTPPASSNTINILMTFFYVDREFNVPTYFSSMILLIAAVLLGYIFLLKYQRKDDYSFYWAVLGLGFLAMSVDEFVDFHGKIDLSSQGDGDLSQWFHYSWVIAGLVVVAVVGLFFLRFLFNLEAKTRNRFLIAGALYVFGAIGMEIIAGFVTVQYGGKENFFYAILSHLEEILEMVGVSYFIYALLCYLSTQRGKVSIIHSKEKG